MTTTQQTPDKDDLFKCALMSMCNKVFADVEGDINHFFRQLREDVIHKVTEGTQTVTKITTFVDFSAKLKVKTQTTLQNLRSNILTGLEELQEQEPTTTTEIV